MRVGKVEEAESGEGGEQDAYGYKFGQRKRIRLI